MVRRPLGVLLGLARLPHRSLRPLGTRRGHRGIAIAIAKSKDGGSARVYVSRSHLSAGTCAHANVFPRTAGSVRSTMTRSRGVNWVSCARASRADDSANQHDRDTRRVYISLSTTVNAYVPDITEPHPPQTIIAR